MDTNTVNWPLLGVHSVSQGFEKMGDCHYQNGALYCPSIVSLLSTGSFIFLHRLTVPNNCPDMPQILFPSSDKPSGSACCILVTHPWMPRKSVIVLLNNARVNYLLPSVSKFLSKMQLATSNCLYFWPPIHQLRNRKLTSKQSAAMNSSLTLVKESWRWWGCKSTNYRTPSY